MATPRESLGDSADFDEPRAPRSPRAAPAVRPESHVIATPRTSAASSLGPRSPRGQRLLATRPENHTLETPRTSVGSATRLRLSLGSISERLTSSQKWKLCLGDRLCLGMCVGLLLLLVVFIIGIIIHFAISSGSHPAPLPNDDSSCSSVQIDHGCAAGFCSSTGQCRCTPNYDQLDAATCAMPLSHHRMSFHVYRALSDEDWSATSGVDSVTAYSLEGILWYVQNFVVSSSCPRNFNATRIVRFKVDMFNTDTPFLEWKGQFGPFVTFDQGRCTSPSCAGTWERYGYVVGCLPWSSYMGGGSYGNTSQLYSFPGASLSAGAGGRCTNPNGSRNCTWNLAHAGEVRLDALENISDYSSFCAAGGAEYQEERDAGAGCTFWDNQKSPLANAQRVAKVQELFKRLYPKTALPEPTCDSQNAACHFHDGCRTLSGNCCPANTGAMLACCGQDRSPLLSSASPSTLGVIA
eukprot:TRINITY_DN83780_c0_g1_i1.p1 TRINITY_DN83780_c0_g1~~TRINITY_DN83780_c0_g1_i1.p1  ORF type:complete len:499 (-),score=51.01 TRINITY_DN83780_c0_g1_i1:75-1472(-)